MGIIELKVKVVNLADEAKYIRKQEKKARRLSQQHKVWNRIAKLGLEDSEARIMFAELMGAKSKLEPKERSRRISKLPQFDTVSVHHETFMSLQGHRRGVVSRASRTAQLAYAFMRGVPYKDVESKVHDNNVLSQESVKYVVDMVRRFGGNSDGVEQWFKVEEAADAAVAA